MFAAEIYVQSNIVELRAGSSQALDSSAAMHSMENSLKTNRTKENNDSQLQWSTPSYAPSLFMHSYIEI